MKHCDIHNRDYIGLSCEDCYNERMRGVTVAKSATVPADAKLRASYMADTMVYDSVVAKYTTDEMAVCKMEKIPTLAMPECG